MYKLFFKRIFDLLLAIAALPFLLLIFVILGPIIYFEDKGPIMYNARRLGKKGKVFIMYKFRSMRMNSPDWRNVDGSTSNFKDDPRLTKIGKFIRKTSLDETPQILNIIKGDMSVVGPRPDLPEAIRIYSLSEKRKLLVRPGITGYSQAYFRNSIQPSSKFNYDVYYVKHLSLLLDIKIFCLTLFNVVLRKNVFNEQSPLENKDIDF